MLISLLYELVLWFLALLALPKMIYQMIFVGKYRQSFFNKWGKGFPHIEKGDRKLIWVHAVSMGETKAIAGLVKKLKTEGDNHLILVSSITETGHAEALKAIPEADYHVFMPFDFYAVISPIVAKVRPDLVVLCETDFWFNFLKASKKNGAFICLVNGKISIRSLNRFRQFSAFSKKLFGCIDLFCLQSEHYKNRFAELGIPSDKMFITGNLKFDNEPPMLSESEKADLKAKLGIMPENKVLVIGSSHDPEEKQLLTVMQKIWQSHPSLKVILVPRHPERFDAVAGLLEAMKIPYNRYSQGLCDPLSKVVLIDAMRQLLNCYQLADIAIVAGSYTEKVGGHNIIEPLWFGVPTIFGPCMHSQPELVELVCNNDAGLMTPIDKLEETLLMLLDEQNKAQNLKKKGLKLVENMRGSLDRTFSTLTRMKIEK